MQLYALAHLNLKTTIPCDEWAAIIISILQVRKLRELKWIVQDHKSSK